MTRPQLSDRYLAAHRRRRLLEGAAEAVAVLGSDKVKVAELVTFSHCARNAFYEMFGSRDDCLRQLLETAASELFYATADGGLAGALDYLRENANMARVLIVDGWAIDAGVIDEYTMRFAELLHSPAGPREELLIAGAAEMLRAGLRVDGVDTLPTVAEVGDFLGAFALEPA